MHVKYYKLDGTLRVEIPVVEGTNFGERILYTPNGWAIDAGEWSPDETIILTSDQKWFTFFFPDKLYCLTAVFDSDGTLFGYAIDLTSKIENEGKDYRITDLELDIWIKPDGKVLLLDEDEFEDAAEQNLISSVTALEIQQCANELLKKCALKEFPENILEKKYLMLFPSKET